LVDEWSVGNRMLSTMAGCKINVKGMLLFINFGCCLRGKWYLNRHMCQAASR